MDKKTAFITLLENSFIVPDKAKRALLLRLDRLPQTQFDELGKLLAQEQKLLIKDRETIIKRSKLLLDTLELITT